MVGAEMVVELTARRVGLLDTPGPHLFRREPIERWPLESQYRQIRVDLSPVMNLMLDHGPEPLPHRQLRAAGSHALPLQIRGRQTSEDLHRLGMHPVQVGTDLLVAIRKLAAMPWIPARPE